MSKNLNLATGQYADVKCVAQALNCGIIASDKDVAPFFHLQFQRKAY